MSDDDALTLFHPLIALIDTTALFGPVSHYRVFAYIDPGTGSFLLQLALAGLFGAAYALKHFWSQVRRFVARLFSSRAEDDADR